MANKYNKSKGNIGKAAILKCKGCGKNLYSQPHKPGCPCDPYSDFRKENKKQYKEQVELSTDKPIEVMMLRPPSSEMDIKCAVCGTAYNFKGEPFSSWEEASQCCDWEDEDGEHHSIYSKEYREEVERRLSLDWKRQQKHKKNGKKNKNSS